MISTLLRKTQTNHWVEYSGDDGNIDIVQESGTCPTGVTTCSGVINLDITSDDATITINQKDTSD